MRKRIMNAPDIALPLRIVPDDVRPVTYGWSELRLHAEMLTGATGLIALGFRNFAMVNDAYGWSAGNEALKTTLARIRSCLKTTERAAWCGGDSFVALINGRSEAQVRQLCERLANRMSTPIEWEGRQIKLSPTVGASSLSASGNVARMMYEADFALRQQRNRQGGAVVFQQRNASDFESKIAQEALHALHGGDFYMLFQPQVTLRDGRLIGFESLLRWDHPELGPLSPADFIPVMERSGYMDEVGLWVIRETLSSFFYSFPSGKSDLRISVNVSPSQMGGVEFVHGFKQALLDSKADVGRVDVEITENALVVESAEDVCAALGSIGVSLVLDDFGAGFSSLGYLKRLPVKKLKLDRQFLTGADSGDPFLQAVVAMAKPLGVLALAEGVETKEQHAMLASLGYDEAQGFLYGKAASLGDMSEIRRRACRGESIIFDGKRFV